MCEPKALQQGDTQRSPAFLGNSRHSRAKEVGVIQPLGCSWNSHHWTKTMRMTQNMTLMNSNMVCPVNSSLNGRVPHLIRSVTHRWHRHNNQAKSVQIHLDVVTKDEESRPPSHISRQSTGLQWVWTSHDVWRPQLNFYRSAQSHANSHAAGDVMPFKPISLTPSTEKARVGVAMQQPLWQSGFGTANQNPLTFHPKYAIEGSNPLLHCCLLHRGSVCYALQESVAFG
eukprot:TRINITY_DN186_c0_g1_i12.p1 TRINITY_DN186_c0_g1~~TRINITY_DN186_c0_g1_i12.p1  ORF type:complete len:228 (-),score=-8.96 TRINITY_DN186_c0_g1_i12:45-728(-)